MCRIFGDIFMVIKYNLNRMEKTFTVKYALGDTFMVIKYNLKLS